jgi:hypothetical protein
MKIIHTSHVFILEIQVWLYIWKLMHIMQHINKIKDKKSHDLSIDAEKTLTKFSILNHKM